MNQDISSADYWRIFYYSYTEREVKDGQGSKEDIKKGYNLWIDVVNPTESELSNLQQSFSLDEKAFETHNQSKKDVCREE